jgi:phospholipase C
VREQFAPDQPPLTARDREASDVLAVLPLLDEARTDCHPVPVPQVPGRLVPGTSRERGLNEFEASLLELGGAVRTRIRRPEVARMAPDGAVPFFRPDPVMTAAARERVMTRASEASRAVTEVVEHFTQP